ncbi:MAG TPA: trigger factor [Solirubrobacteraceae bacterium]|nr:trigger factor [Solirubrobacteraceae bacterium]
MAAAVQTTVTELPESRVRVDVRVPAEHVETRVQGTARRLGRELKLPGFRKGKVPAPLVLQRIGRDAVLDEAVRDGLPSWYAEAIHASEIVPVGDPKIELGELPGQGGELEFTIEIGVLPKADLGEYLGLEAPRREPAVAEEQIEREVEGMRERLARLETVERPAQDGDFVVVDYVGRLGSAEESSTQKPAETTLVPSGAPRPTQPSGLGAPVVGEGRDQLVELGAGNLIPGFAEGLFGAGAGETRTVDLTFPGDYGAAELAGREASFQITVKEVKHKQLPDLDEDFAIDAGFDDIQELRADIRGRLLDLDERRAQEEFREAALDAAVDRATVPVTEELTQARAREMWERMLHSLAHRGISRESYLQISGREESQLLAEMAPDAERALRREALLTAVVAAEGIAPSEQDLLQALTPTAEREGIAPEQVLEQLRAAGRLQEAREDLAARQAVELIAAQAKPIPLERAQARERLWTPESGQEREQERAGAAAGETGSPGGLWTPGS